MEASKQVKSTMNYVTYLELDKVWLTGSGGAENLDTHPSKDQVYINIRHDNERYQIKVSSQEIISAAINPNGWWDLDKKIQSYLKDDGRFNKEV